MGPSYWGLSTDAKAVLGVPLVVEDQEASVIGVFSSAALPVLMAWDTPGVDAS